MYIKARIKKHLRDFDLDVDFSVNNEVLALLGWSGCGKSMTLKCIAGIETPDDGYIEMDGVVLYDSNKRINLPPQKRKVGYLFQNYALFPNMTVKENVFFVTCWEKEKAEENFVNLVNSLNLKGLENAYPSQLSGGQQQRVAFARVLASDSKILLLDEPFSALDTSLKWQMESELGKLLQYYDHTALLVSHDKGEVYRISDKVAVMNNGKILEMADKRNLFLKPKTFETALLTGITNISEYKKIDENRIKALDWGIELKVEENIIGDNGHIALGTELITVVDKPNTEKNDFKFRICVVIEDISDYIVILKSDENQLKPIRWRVNKEMWQTLSNKNEVCLRLSPETLILLPKNI